MSATCSACCHSCDRPATRCRWQPVYPGPGLELQPLCEDCAVYGDHDPLWPLMDLVIDGDLGRLDRGRVGGGVVCADCGKEYYSHPRCRSATFLTVLCDGSVAKL